MIVPSRVFRVLFQLLRQFNVVYIYSYFSSAFVHECTFYMQLYKTTILHADLTSCYYLESDFGGRFPSEYNVTNVHIPQDQICINTLTSLSWNVSAIMTLQPLLTNKYGNVYVMPKVYTSSTFSPL